MEALVNTTQAVTQLRNFLLSDSNPTAATNDVEDLFAPVREDDHISIDVEIAFIVAPAAHRVPLYFVVPNEVMHGTICVVTPPPQRAFKDNVLACSEDGDEVAKRVKRVIDTKKLSVKVVDPVAVRAFSKSYDNFVLYGVHKYPKQLSGEFLGHQKTPVWVAKKVPFEKALHNATKTVVVSRRGQNAVTSRIGHTGMSPEEVEENLKCFIEKFTSHRQGASLDRILHIRVAGTNLSGKRAGLPVFGHTFKFTKGDSSEDAEGPAKKARTEN